MPPTVALQEIRDRWWARCLDCIIRVWRRVFRPLDSQRRDLALSRNERLIKGRHFFDEARYGKPFKGKGAADKSHFFRRLRVLCDLFDAVKERLRTWRTQVSVGCPISHAIRQLAHSTCSKVLDTADIGGHKGQAGSHGLN